jgi:hypothetical protein
MSATTTQAEIRLETLLDERQVITEKWEALNARINTREDKTLSETEQEHQKMYRERVEIIDGETESLSTDIIQTRESIEKAADLRRKMAGSDGTIEEGENGEIVYRDFAAYARDVILTRGTPECAKIANQAGGEEVSLKARERLQLLKARTPANTLSSNVAGLNPPEHIAQIFQIIDKSRPLVAASPSTGLVRGTITYPSVDTRPVVAVQASEKTEAGNTGMVVSMKTAAAVTYLGGGDLSWQALNWSTPDALQLWFDLVAADYALKTETAAADAVIDDGFTNVISDVFTMGSSDFTAFLKAVGEGYAKVYAESHRIADTILLAPDVYGYLIGLTSTPQPIFISVNGQNIGPLNVIVSRGLDSGTALVCDLEGFLVAETPGAPVELRVVEPAIGGLEVGLIGAFKPVVVDPGSFALISAGS